MCVVFCQPIVSMHFCFFFSSTTFDRSDVIRATFEMSGRAKHNTFAARIGASGDCCNTYKNAIINTSFLIMFRGNVAEMVLLLCVSPGKWNMLWWCSIFIYFFYVIRQQNECSSKCIDMLNNIGYSQCHLGLNNTWKYPINTLQCNLMDLCLMSSMQ